MLFKFGKFWKSIAFVICAWAFYGVCGFEFATVTLLAIIVAINSSERLKFF